ncbi:methyl-accepting chemotaxis protein [bacterium]|nr:methyl-accepting chemotaxis protein [bacterium]
MLDNIKFRTQLILGNSIILILVIVIGIVVYQSIESLIEDSRLVTHTYKVIGNGNRLVEEMINMETGLRGFLVGSNETFLDPYNKGREDFTKVMAATKIMVSDNPSQVRLLEEIEKQAEKWIEMIATVQIAAKRKVNEGAEVQANFKEIQSRVYGKRIFDKIRDVLSTMDKKHQRNKNQMGQNRVQALIIDLVNMETGKRGFLLNGLEESLEIFHQGHTSLNKNLETYKNFVTSSENLVNGLSEIDDLKSLIKEWLEKAVYPEIEARNEVNKITISMDDVATMVASGLGKKTMDGIRANSGEFISIEENLLAERSKVTANTANLANNVVIFGILLTVVLGTVIVFTLVRTVMRQLGGEPAEVARIVSEIAKGNLSLDLGSVHDKRGLYANMVIMTENLRTQISEIMESVNILASSSKQVSESVSQLASSSVESAAAVSETSTTVDEVRQTAEIAHQKAKMVSDSSQAVSQAALDGIEITEKSISGLADIKQQMDFIAESTIKLSEQSQIIGDIINTVADLAEQSNLLAVNAAIEAVKAGEYGKGFNVVALEIRRLADQSKEATINVRNILNDIQKAVSKTVLTTEQGGKVVDATEKQGMLMGESIRKLAKNVTESAQAATQISVSSQQQLVGMDQVSKAMNDVRQASEQTLDNSRQLEVSAGELSDVGQRLKLLVGKYSF